MISGPVMIQVLEGENAIAKNRDLMGATDPKKGGAGDHSRRFRRIDRRQRGARLRRAGDRRGPRSPTSSRRWRSTRGSNRHPCSDHETSISSTSTRGARPRSSPAARREAVSRAADSALDASRRRARFRRDDRPRQDAAREAAGPRCGDPRRRGGARLDAPADGTRKWLLDVGAGNAIETVFIPEDDRGTLCVSSQAGCALDCAFCSTGRQGFNRNLAVAEIIGQLWRANRALLADGVRRPGSSRAGTRSATW